MHTAMYTVNVYRNVYRNVHCRYLQQMRALQIFSDMQKCVKSR